MKIFSFGLGIWILAFLLYSEDLPIDDWLHNVNGQWKVYNMVIDHVDIVKNVRVQFDRVITKSSLQDLLQRVKEQNSRS